jgi:hypothetical protein
MSFIILRTSEHLFGRVKYPNKLICFHDNESNINKHSAVLNGLEIVYVTPENSRKQCFRFVVGSKSGLTEHFEAK